MLAFVGPCPAGQIVIRFPDKDRTNNRLTNLRYGTLQEREELENYRPKGEANVHAVLTEAQVREIRVKHAMGALPSRLSRDYRVTRANIVQIVKRRSWKHVT